MEKKLKDLFDFQRYHSNARLERLIQETRSRYGQVSDDDLEWVSAAGNVHTSKEPQLWDEDE